METKTSCEFVRSRSEDEASPVDDLARQLDYLAGLVQEHISLCQRDRSWGFDALRDSLSSHFVAIGMALHLVTAPSSLKRDAWLAFDRLVRNAGACLEGETGQASVLDVNRANANVMVLTYVGSLINEFLLMIEATLSCRVEPLDLGA